MANIHQKRAENIDGDFYVDDTCIDCDTCRWMASHVFHETNGQSAVFAQPITAEDKKAALQALVACPTASIGLVNKEPLLSEVAESFPIPIDEKWMK